MYFIPTAHLSSDQPYDRCSVATVATLLDITLERLDQEVLPRQWKYTNPLICPSVLLISTCLLGTYHMPATFSSAYKNAYVFPIIKGSFTLPSFKFTTCCHPFFSNSWRLNTMFITPLLLIPITSQVVTLDSIIILTFFIQITVDKIAKPKDLFQYFNWFLQLHLSYSRSQNSACSFFNLL